MAAAERGSSDAQGALGALYAEGAGVVKNYVEALKWFTVAAASGDEGASKLRDKLEMQLSPTQIAQAQQLAKLYVERRSKGNPASPKDKPKSDGPAVSGTAFFISSDGYLLTNYHVVKNYRKIVVHVEGNDMPARVVKSDIGNDLSILKVEGNFDAIPLGNVRDVSLGDSVMTIGFPNIEIQGTAPKLTKGEISALSGLQDDPRFFQISVPVQPGNSGGPLVDEHGNVIAVTTAQLSALAMMKSAGSIPQNVNYALKISYAQLLIDTVPSLVSKLPKAQGDKTDMSKIIKDTQKATALVLTWQ